MNTGSSYVPESVHYIYFVKLSVVVPIPLCRKKLVWYLSIELSVRMNLAYGIATMEFLFMPKDDENFETQIHFW